jgi:hypothetical protein
VAARARPVRATNGASRNKKVIGVSCGARPLVVIPQAAGGAGRAGRG